MSWMYRKPKKKKDESFPLLESAGVKTPKKVNYKDRADRWFSKYIRMRDAMANGYGKCISCGRILPIKNFDAGHFIRREILATRFDEDNVNIECQYCNRFRSDHIVDYSNNLRNKIGETRYNMLLVRSKKSRKISAFEYEQMIEYYKKEVKKLEKEKGFSL